MLNIFFKALKRILLREKTNLCTSEMVLRLLQNKI